MLEQQRSTFVVSGMGVLMEAKKSSTTGLLLMTSPSGTKSLLLLLLDRVVVVGLLLFVVVCCWVAVCVTDWPHEHSGCVVLVEVGSRR